MRILIVEDDPRIAEFLRRGLNAEGNYCVVADYGEVGLSLVRDGDFDLLLLDLVLPGLHGHEVCQRLRMQKVDIPIIILTGLDSLDDINTGMRMGADDYVTKPFVLDDLLARIDAVIQRKHAAASQDSTLKAGRLAFDRQSLRFTIADKEISMTAKELAIIELLMSKPGTLFSRDRIVNNVWGLNMNPLTNVLEAHIRKLRIKLDRGSPASMIENVRGHGYRLLAGELETSD